MIAPHNVLLYNRALNLITYYCRSRKKIMNVILSSVQKQLCHKTILRKLPNSGGSILGTVSTDLDGEDYFRFRGIPYAQPPLGNLRFKAPVPVEPWSGLLDATKEGSGCYSRHPYMSKRIEGSEDCLYLNVYTKNLSGKDLKSVMFWIHGSAFVFGNGGTEFSSPDYLMTEDVVVVTLNYRLGILGYLSFEDPSLEVPGNAGFKDVVLALKWVRDHIDNFGGDPRNVTIFGQSTGATAVHLLMLSQLSRGLFHKAIAQSGSASHYWASADKRVSECMDPKARERDIYEKLKAMPVHDLVKIQKKIDIEYVPSVQRPFGYVIEKPKEQAFMAEDPASLMSRGDFEHVPFLIGHTSVEMMGITLSRKIKWPGFSTCEDLISWRLGHKIGSEESLALAEKLRKYYLGSDRLVEDYKERLTMESDICYASIVITTAMNHLRKSKTPIYLYSMSIETKLNLMKEFLKLKMPGATHSDDLEYLFKSSATPRFEKGSLEDIAVRRFVRLWTNFAKYGNPTPSKEDLLLAVNWKPITEEETHNLDLGMNLTMSADSEYAMRARFLKALLKL